MFEFRVVAQRFALMLVLVAVATVAGLSNSRAGAPDASPVGTWTIVIPEGFPNDVFTWRLKADGTYEEDGRDAKTGQSVQPTYTGRWSVADGRMTLQQNEFEYVFAGPLIGDRYSGMLTLAGREVSYFCAAKGDQAPRTCDKATVTARNDRPAPAG
jgi:hypothetical protein